MKVIDLFSKFDEETLVIFGFLNTDVLKLFSSNDTSNIEIDVDYDGKLGTKVKVTKYTE